MKKLGRKTVYESNWLDLHLDKVELNDGSIIESFHVVDHHREGVTVVVENEKEEILFVKAYRYLTNSEEWETPAGGAERNEDILETGKREVLEETGYHIKNLEWCTNSENVKHSHDKLKRTFSAYGENHANSKTVSQYSKDNILINIYGSVNEAGRQLGIQFTNIAKCARGERKTAGGFVWKYENLKHSIYSEIEHCPQTRYEIMNTYFIPNYVEKTGYDCAKWLVEYCINNNKSLPKYAIQSANPVGRENINSLLTNFNKFNKNV